VRKILLSTSVKACHTDMEEEGVVVVVVGVSGKAVAV
jgi:hypothetical protein